MNLDKALTVMEEAAINAGRVLDKMQPETRRLESRKDFLTDADLKSEEIILRALATEYPNIPSFSEEKGGTEIKEGYLWIVDPIDGTINFFLQDDHWGISIALAENGHTIAGVIYLPARKEMFSASRDTAARFSRIEKQKTGWTNLSVSREEILANSQFCVCWGKEEHGGKDIRKACDVIASLALHALCLQVRNSATANMMMAACGKITGCVFTKPEPFDIAAAGLIIERAGGRVTDMDGNQWGPFSRSLVATNGLIHNDLLRIIKT